MCSQLRGAPERGSQGAAGKMVRGNNHGLHGSYMEKKYMRIYVWKIVEISQNYVGLHIYIYIHMNPIIYGISPSYMAYTWVRNHCTRKHAVRYAMAINQASFLGYIKA